MKLIPDFLRFGRRDIVGSSISGLENPSVDLTAALVASVDGASSSGTPVTPLKAFRLAAVTACVRAIAEPIASLPIEITQQDRTEEGRELVRTDSRWNLLNGFPNPEQTSVELFENWIAHALLWGRGYLYTVRNGAGEPIELWPLNPSATEPMRSKNGTLYYLTQLADGTHQKVPAEFVIPLHSILGISPVMNARDVIAGAASAEQYAGRFWANNGRPGGLIELPESMDEEEMDDFQRRWKAGHEGLKRAQLVGILTGGAKWQEVGIAPGQAQFIETRQFGVREIARLYRVPPHMIGDLDGTISRTSIEQLSIEFITQTLRPWLVRAEQALRFKLFNSKGDLANAIYPQFNFDALARGDTKARFEAYAIGVQWGIISRADARRREGLTTAPDEQLLEDFLVPLNMIPSSKLHDVDPRTTGGGGGDGVTKTKGTQPTTGSDGSTPQTGKNALALLSGMVREDAELAEALSQLALKRANGHAAPPDE